MQRKKTRSIVILGRRWWSRTSGNTKMTVRIFVNGDLKANLEDWGSCSGNYYQQLAWEWLKANGYLPGGKDDRRSALWHYRDDFGISLIQDCCDVALMGDL